MINQNFIKLYEDAFKLNWDLPALSEYNENKDLFYSDFAYDIARFHILFEEIGLKKGDKVALAGKNNITWCTAYLSVITYGGIVVPILPDFPIEGIQHIINHSESVLLFSSDSIWDSIDENQLPNVKAIYSLNSMKCLCTQESIYRDVVNSLDEKISVKYPNGFQKEDIKYADVNNSEVILLNYTSGTTGFSKGVMLTANNLAGNVMYVHYLKLLNRGERLLSFLPLAHAYGCAFEFLYALTNGIHITLLGKTPSPKILSQALAEVKPHLVVAVPLVIEKIYKKAVLPQLEKPAIKAALKIPVIKNRIYAKFRQKLTEGLGGCFHQVIIGGAALNSEVEAFLYKIKLPFTVGYGMTECGPLISVDQYYEFIPTSCGRILDNIMEVRIDSEDPYSIAGEIQVRGENVMKGYYKNEELTKTVFTEDGWLRTGDLGTINKTNRIFIRGRLKTMILSSNGQNIYPEEIEARLNNLPYITESLVIQRNNKLVALVYPDYEALDAAKIDPSKLGIVMEENKSSLNKMVAAYETIATIQIFPTEFEKTPKKSIKRYLYEN